MNKPPLQSYRRKNILSPLEKINNPDIIRVINLIRFSEIDLLWNKSYIQDVLSLYEEWEKFIKNPYQSTEQIELLLEKIRRDNISLSYPKSMEEDYFMISTWINEVWIFIQNNASIQELMLADINTLLGSLRNPATAKISSYGLPETIEARISQAKIIFPEDIWFHAQLSKIKKQITDNSLGQIEQINTGYNCRINSTLK